MNTCGNIVHVYVINEGLFVLKFCSMDFPFTDIQRSNYFPKPQRHYTLMNLHEQFHSTETSNPIPWNNRIHYKTILSTVTFFDPGSQFYSWAPSYKSNCQLESLSGRTGLTVYTTQLNKDQEAFTKAETVISNGQKKFKELFLFL